MINKRNALENKLIDILSKYYIKSIKKIWKKSSDSEKKYKDFQKELLLVTEWSDRKIEKEYKRFNRWLEEYYSISDEYISNLIFSILKLNINITGPELDTEIFTFPSKTRVFYKCFKSVSRFFYENPTFIKDNDMYNDTVIESIKVCLRNFIPLTEILRAIEEAQDYEDKKIPYDFQDLTSISTFSNFANTKSNSENGEDIPKKISDLIIEKENEEELEYISSNDLYDEYYNSNDEKNVKVDDNTEDDVKLITVPKLKQNYNGFKKSYQNKNYYNNNNNNNKYKKMSIDKPKAKNDNFLSDISDD